MSLGNGNGKQGGKKSNFAYEYGTLKKLNDILDANNIIKGLIPLLNKEVTQLNVLDAIIDQGPNLNIQVLLVKDLGNGDEIVQQVINYSTDPAGVEYIDIDGNDYIPTGPLEYIEPTTSLDLIVSELGRIANINTGQASDIAVIKSLTDMLNSKFSTLGQTISNNSTPVVLSTEQEALLTDIQQSVENVIPQSRTHTYLNVVTAGTVPAGTLRGSIINVGDELGLWNGQQIPPGIAFEWGSVGSRDTYGAFTFDPTSPGLGTNFLIEYTL